VSASLSTIIDRLVKYYGGLVRSREFLAIKALVNGMHPVGVLISIVLTQNTSDRVAVKALENLVRRFGRRLEPEALMRSSVDEVADLIRVSGMHRLKARTIFNILKALDGGDALLREDPERLREILTSIPGVGPKTADVFLLMFRRHPTFPVDTHIRRVLTRLGIVSEGEGYEEIRAKVMKSIDPGQYLTAHLILIKHGREVCRARKPLCSRCPINDLCPRVGLPKTRP